MSMEWSYDGSFTKPEELGKEPRKPFPAARLAGTILAAVLVWLFYVGYLTGIPGPGSTDKTACIAAVDTYKHTHPGGFVRGWRVFVKTQTCQGRTW